MGSNERLIQDILILRCQTGDAGALAQLIRQYEKPLRYFITRLIGDSQTAEDLFQETWLSVFRRLSTLKKAESFGAWLYHIARNKVYHHLRITKRLTEFKESLPVPEDAVEPTFTASDAAAIHTGLGRLEPQHKEVLMLRFLEQMPYQEMAEVIGCNIGTVRSRLHYAKQALRQLLEK